MKKIIIAIDGFSSCGKSTLAKGLATALEYAYLDSGAMYRATTLFFLNNQIDFNDTEQVQAALKQIRIDFSREENKNCTFLNGKNVEQAIRTMRVSNVVSQVAAISEVRRSMVRLQRQAGENKAIVMDGRDIGTVVFPNAELKVFLSADLATRVQRRYLEILPKNPEITRQEVQKNLQERDFIDSTRKDSPLKQAEDAVLIDNTNLTVVEQLAMTKALALERMKINV